MYRSRHLAHRRRVLAGLLAAPALAMALLACSPDAAPTAGASGDLTASDPGATPGASSGAPAGAPSDADRNAARDAYDLALAGCIRDQGVDVADPAPGEGITESGPEVEAAASACVAVVGPPPTYQFTPAEDQALHEGYLALAACLRERGYDVADPAPGEAIAISGVSDADFQACQVPG